jgi:hypothetical protein
MKHGSHIHARFGVTGPWLPALARGQLHHALHLQQGSGEPLL